MTALPDTRAASALTAVTLHLGDHDVDGVEPGRQGEYVSGRMADDVQLSAEEILELVTQNAEIGGCWASTNGAG